MPPEPITISRASNDAEIEQITEALRGVRASTALNCGFDYPILLLELTSAAAIRSAVTLISMAARYPFPQKVFGRVEDAIPWLLSCSTHRSAERAFDTTKLIEIARSLRGQLRSSAAAG